MNNLFIFILFLYNILTICKGYSNFDRLYSNYNQSIKKFSKKDIPIIFDKILQISISNRYNEYNEYNEYNINNNNNYIDVVFIMREKGYESENNIILMMFTKDEHIHLYDPYSFYFNSYSYSYNMDDLVTILQKYETIYYSTTDISIKDVDVYNFQDTINKNPEFFEMLKECV